MLSGLNVPSPKPLLYRAMQVSARLHVRVKTLLCAGETCSFWLDVETVYVRGNAMKLKLTILCGVIAFGVGFGLWGASSPADAGEASVAGSAAVVLTAMGPEDSPYSYVGSKKCKKCHSKQHKSWRGGVKAKAIDTLMPGNAKEIKEKSGLDVAKDYSADPACLKCHATGYGKTGGYAVPPPDDKKAARKAKSLAGVGCESCHGPGSGYVKLHEEIMKSKRKYTSEEMYAAGLLKIDESTCKTCHDAGGPTAPAEPFDFERMKVKLHKNFPLKQRQE